VEQRIETLMSELRAGLLELYGPRLKGVYLFGSYARGEQEAESDVDVLVVLDDFGDYGEEVDRAISLTSKLSLAHDVSVSKVFVRERDWLHGDTPFLKNVREEAVLA
jgi:predicted nucleotidyltransferase